MFDYYFLTRIPYMPAWTGWSQMQRLAKGGPTW